MSWATEGLSEEELRRFRGVQRRKHGTILVRVWSQGGASLASYRAPNDVDVWELDLPVDEVRVIYAIDHLSWVETYKGDPNGSRRARGRHGGWQWMYRYRIPLP